jgi:hypothetical protein
MTTRSGGGINSRVVSHTNAPKVEPRPHPVSPGAVSRLGTKVGPGTPNKPLYYNHISASTPVGPTNNTENLGPGGCGRQVMRSGSQSVTPKVAPRTHGPKTF